MSVTDKLKDMLHHASNPDERQTGGLEGGGGQVQIQDFEMGGEFL